MTSFTGISPSFEAWAIRHKPTGGYLPMRWKRARGYSHDEPEVGAFPRLFRSERSARAALTAWVSGVWAEDRYYDSYNGEYETSGPYFKGVEHRRREDMEVVRFRLVDVTGVPDADPDLRHEPGCFARANKALAAAGEERRHACTCSHDLSGDA